MMDYTTIGRDKLIARLEAYDKFAKRLHGRLEHYRHNHERHEKVETLARLDTASVIISDLNEIVV